MKLPACFVLFTASLFGCHSESPTLFQLISPQQSHITFSNRIVENDTFNILKEEYIYNGGGVGVGDFDNDGLPDLYFTGNMVDNALYLNQGGMQFDDITSEAKVGGNGQWCSGVALVDINQDGWLDIYVSSTLSKDSLRRKNLLYVNQGLNDNEVPTFSEAAEDYGIADTGNTTQAAFFDYDLDGDLDLYLLTNVIDAKVPTNYRDKITDGSALNNDHLYRNDMSGPGGKPGGGFTDVTQEAGITTEGFGLGITVSDINLDGWPDIYITNDYISNDLLYINNQNGTFTNRVADYLKHQSYSAMGSDVVDINNDGLSDIIALDMLPESNLRQKQMLGANNYTTYINNDRYGYQHQYVRNTLQLNRGLSPAGPGQERHPIFSEIGQLAGIEKTDWSWTPLVADFDNDGYRDMIITNGFPRDVTDRDFANFRAGPAGGVASPMMLQDSIPIVDISNYAYRNNGDLTFDDKTADWGMYRPSFSNGAAYADLDNDGDLDVVVNNINDSAFVYENQLYETNDTEDHHYLRIMLVGSTSNQGSLGAKVMVRYGGGQMQYFENAQYRGYLSTVENRAHFGMGGYATVDTVQVVWPDGKSQVLLDIAADQEITLRYTDAETAPAPDIHRELLPASRSSHLEEVSVSRGLRFASVEADKIDFNLQRTLPHKLSQLGPGVAVGDINGDRRDDLYIGGGASQRGEFFVQQSNGTFVSDGNRWGDTDASPEETGVLLFDADSDGDQDLYAVSGSYEFAPNSPALQDRLYMNDGQGKFVLAAQALPELYGSGSCVRAADYDGDGDLDLFVGGRVVPGAYPVPSASYILANEGGTFTDVTAQMYPALQDLGMVSDALWTDVDTDGKVDLLIVGEWMPITFLKNTGQGFENATESTGVANHTGWWNSLTAGDFDHDGDTDYLVGNQGLNTRYRASQEEPLRIYAKDFDANGSVDPVLVGYGQAEDGGRHPGSRAPFPLHAKDDFVSQFLRVRRQFPTYEKYGRATIDAIFSPEDLEDAIVLEATTMTSSYLENQGGGKLVLRSLPVEAQFAPVFGMLAGDFDHDGWLDALLVGNDYGADVFSGRSDALTGVYLAGDGQGNFRAVTNTISGFFVDGDAKGIAHVQGVDGASLVAVTQNRDSLRVFAPVREVATAQPTILLKPLDAWAELTLTDGTTRRQEFYYGSTYLSQSGRTLALGSDIASGTIYSFTGEKRVIEVDF